ncbi:hypothetical protein HDU87_003200 [Geranomyces variabilis]|uniref:Uncharacterized protein n=1 Tax=Geranomyces variabilis TaxID=109894 RepID=A0AAD5TL36_9FUNG|nr:hypothetical protein HDU87_003200 [Geranomyces variabilis]
MASTLYACPCLNVKLRVATAHQQPPLPQPPTPSPSPSPPKATPITTPTPPAASSPNVTTAAASAAHAPLPYVSETDKVAGFKAKLGLGGISIEHRLLLKHILHHPGPWLEVVCANCSTSCYFIHADPSSHNAAIPDLAANAPHDGIVLLGAGLITGPAVTVARGSPTYSEPLRVVLMSNHAPETRSAQEYGLADAWAAFDAGVRRGLEAKRVEMEEKVAAYRAEQVKVMEQAQARIRRDAEILWAQVCNLHKERLGKYQQRPGSATSPADVPSASTMPFAGMDAATVGSFYGRQPTFGRRRSSFAAAAAAGGVDGAAAAATAAFVAGSSPRPKRAPTPSAPETTAAADATANAGGGEAPAATTPGAARRVHFGGTIVHNRSAENPGVPPSVVANAPVQDDDSERSDSDDAIFSLDEEHDDDEHRGPPFHVDDEQDDHTATATSDEDNGAESPDAAPDQSALYSSSLPIRIPSMKRPTSAADPDTNNVAAEADDEHDEEDAADETFVAPHVLSARSYSAEDYFAALRPQKTRLTSFAI